jgi:hypothetical protein
MRLVKTRMRMKPGVLCREAIPLCHLPSLSLRLKMQRKAETHGRLDLLGYI